MYAEQELVRQVEEAWLDYVMEQAESGTDWLGNAELRLMRNAFETGVLKGLDIAKQATGVVDEHA